MKKPDLASALGVTSPDIANAVREASRFLRERGVRHALCGGIAVGAYARPRATKDVDFLVGEEAFQHHGLIVVPPLSAVGNVAVDLVSLLPSLGALAPVLDAPEHDGDIPVVPPQALIAMKLVAQRMQDQADIVALLDGGAVDPDECRGWLVERGFDVAMFDRLLEKARGH
ncbi:MAG: hypothetical protein IT383_17640 [Deltaproteobacteria bacterium]|nr:hypothetical protein [Deltaproteobacteria bacterium]